jgi:hypothetical protein
MSIQQRSDVSDLGIGQHKVSFQTSNPGDVALSCCCGAQCQQQHARRHDLKEFLNKHMT